MKVAVVGAGVSGLICIKVCRDYNFDVTCFEKMDDIGGLWRYKPHECDGEASVMKSTIINTSKEMMAFSDFPPPKEYPNFMHNTKVMEYTRLYTDNFQLLPFIQFNTDVKLVERSKDYEETGQWNIVLMDLKSKTTHSEIFDAVFVANGHHTYPYMPKFSGVEKFKGKIMHSHSYKDHSGFEDKRIVVVGIGNSGGDIAVELGRIAQVYLVTRTGAWCLHRVFFNGLPLDAAAGTRFSSYLLKLCPWLANTLMEKIINFHFDHKLYGLECEHRVYNQHPLVNDDLPNRILSGQVVMKPNIKEFCENGLLFEDGTSADQIDHVILCTGYDISFPVVEDGLINVQENRVDDLYKNIFPVGLKHQTLFIIGLVQPWGAIMPISEMQARLCCEVLLKNVSLPPKEEMEKMAWSDHSDVYGRYVGSRRHTIQVDFVPYMDDLASMIGAKPMLRKYLFNDFELFWTLLTGPAAPYQYRLQGPQTWADARETQLTVWERILYPLKSSRRLMKNEMTANKNEFSLKSMKISLILLFLSFVLFIFLFHF